MVDVYDPCFFQPFVTNNNSGNKLTLWFIRYFNLWRSNNSNQHKDEQISLVELSTIWLGAVICMYKSFNVTLLAKVWCKSSRLSFWSAKVNTNWRKIWMKELSKAIINMIWTCNLHIANCVNIGFYFHKVVSSSLTKHEEVVLGKRRVFFLDNHWVSLEDCISICFFIYMFPIIQKNLK